MKKNSLLSFLPPLLVVIILVASFAGRGVDSDLKVNDLFTRSTVTQQTGQISNELANRAYEAVFSLAYATLQAGKGDNGITVQNDGDKHDYFFENVHYLRDNLDATVTGYMKATNGNETDQSEVNLTFMNDPGDLKAVTIVSTGPHRKAHTEGVMSINGEDWPFAKFMEYYMSDTAQKSISPPAS